MSQLSVSIRASLRPVRRSNLPVHRHGRDVDDGQTMRRSQCHTSARRSSWRGDVSALQRVASKQRAAYLRRIRAARCSTIRAQSSADGTPEDSDSRCVTPSSYDDLICEALAALSTCCRAHSTRDEADARRTCAPLSAAALEMVPKGTTPKRDGSCTVVVGFRRGLHTRADGSSRTATIRLDGRPDGRTRRPKRGLAGSPSSGVVRLLHQNCRQCLSSRHAENGGSFWKRWAARRRARGSEPAGVHRTSRAASRHARELRRG